MNSKDLPKLLMLGLTALILGACGGEQPIDLEEIMAKPQAYVGSETCKMCHLEHYDSWKMTAHSRMLRDAKTNPDVIVSDFNEKRIRADLEELVQKGVKLKVPVDQIYIPKLEEIVYTIGGDRVQYYLVEKNGLLYRAPIGWYVADAKWKNSNEANWDKAPWINSCGGCHATGVDLEKNTFSEPAISCESCHGPGSWHAALPKTEVFNKRQTIVNPAKLSSGVAVEVCGSCHNRGKSTRKEGAGWAVGYRPGKPLTAFYESMSYAGGDHNYFYPLEFSKGGHQQYLDWKQSHHAEEGVTCTSCHYVHQLGMPSTGSQTRSSGSQQCLLCHTQFNANMAHSIHSFANCVGCHMPRIAGGGRSHVFATILPQDSVANPGLPNSCQACHRHKDEDMNELQKRFESLARIPKPVGQAIKHIEYEKKR